MLTLVTRTFTIQRIARCLMILGMLLQMQDPVRGAIGSGADVPRARIPYLKDFSRAAAVAPAAANLNPGVMPPNSRAHGLTYGEWTARWWQWALGIPADRNPITDSTGQFCGEGQSGSVWFLAGAFGGDAERWCTLPTGMSVFLPVFNWIFGSAVFDCDPTNPGVPCDVPLLQAAAAAQTAGATLLDVTIDGVPLRNVSQYRAFSPGPFSLALPDNSVIGVPAGTYYPQVADGYWLMLTPFPTGPHTIVVHVKADTPDYGLFDFTVQYHLTVR